MSQPIYCPECGNKLAEQRTTGSWETRRRGRVVVIAPGGIEEITCELCGATWKPSGSADPAQRLAMPAIKRVA